MISIHRLIYEGYSSDDFDLICDVAFDSDSGESSSYLSREAVMSETYRGDMQRIHSYKYTETLEPTITFIDKNFGEFDLDRQRRILKWLTSKDTPSFISIYHDDSEVVSYEILGAFTECNTYKLGNGSVVGFQCTFSSVAPWAFSPLHTIKKDVSNSSDNKVVIDIQTDDKQGAIYPRIAIKQTGKIIDVDHAMGETDTWVDGSVYKYNDKYYWVDKDGNKFTKTTDSSDFDTTSVSICNTHIDNYGNSHTFNSLVKNNADDEQIVLDGANRVVFSSSTRIFGDNFSWQWIPLYDGKNELSFIGNCEVTISYRECRKVGEF